MPPRVLLVGNFLSATRANRGVCEELATHLAAAGWSVRTTSPQARRVRRLLDMVGTAWRARRAYDVAQVDVFSGAAFLWAEAVCECLRAARKPFVLTLHGGNLPRFAARWPNRVRRLLRPAAAVTTPSRYLLVQMRPYRDDLILVPNAIDLVRYPHRPRAHPRPHLAWLRAFHQIYNPILAVTAAARLAPCTGDLSLAMAGADMGDGTLERTRAAINRAGLDAHVILRATGIAKSDVPAWLDTADIFLNTATIDNAPVSLIEAMACGLCIVSTNVGGIPYLLEHERDALLVPPNDPDAMADAVRRIMSDPALAERLSTRARLMAEQFDWAPVLAQWQALLSAAAEQRDS